jgi:DNA repair protein RadA/Sms
MSQKNRLKTLFICSNCDAQYQKWTGRCLECGQWGTVLEKTPEINVQERVRGGKDALKYPSIPTNSLKDISHEASSKRHITGIGELDRVLGGGFVPGSFLLLGGEPGIGKSTLALQLACLIPSSLYISGEESVEQIKLRADRLGLGSAALRLGNATMVEAIIETIKELKPPLAVIDSIQTLFSDTIPGEPGNVTQVRAATVQLLSAAKTSGTSIILIGHVTKDGAVAGPKTLEHLVDTVLYLEGDRHHNMRILRAVKNRFGSTDEVGMFTMIETGMKEVVNPSAAMLLERGESVPGSIVTCLLEGTRPLLVEIQALVTKTMFGYPVRKANGFDVNRLHMILAVLERRAGLPLGQYDVHVNVVGGLKAAEPASDLAVALAVTSALKDKALGKDVAVFGEVGLGGEVRSVRQAEKRMKECLNLGMKKIILPKTHQNDAPKEKPGTSYYFVETLADLIRQTGT